MLILARRTAPAVPTLPRSDLYNHLIGYFDNHLKPLQTVGIYVYYSV